MANSFTGNPRLARLAGTCVGVVKSFERPDTIAARNSSGSCQRWKLAPGSAGASTSDANSRAIRIEATVGAHMMFWPATGLATAAGAVKPAAATARPASTRRRDVVSETLGIAEL